MSTRIGYEGVMRYSTDGGSTWTILDNARDVTINAAMGESDSTTRANGGFRSTEPTLLGLDPEFSMVWDPEDDNFNALNSAFRNRTGLLFQFLDAPEGNGWQGFFKIFSFNKNENLEDVQMVDVTMKVARSDTPPAWVVDGQAVSSSSSSSSGA
ncbi:MAG: hypothetical protein ACIAQF_09200 [Phycisphaerales bacterium JB065]